jgi:hypothetical protein
VKWEDHRSWVLGSIAAALITFAGVVFSAVYTAYYNRTHHIAEWGTIGASLRTPVPLWFVLLLGVLAGFSWWRAFTSTKMSRYLKENHTELYRWQTMAEILKEKNNQLEKGLEAMKAKEPILHGVWNPSQAFWHMGRKANDPSMQIGGWITLSTSNTDETLHLLAAYIGERRADIFMPVSVKPGAVEDQMVMLFFTPPLTENPNEPFTATIVVEDQKNRKYNLPRFTFRATPGQTPPSIPSPETALPVLHASWPGDSVWGWVTPHPEEEPIYMIRGDVTLLMDNIKESVIMTGVEIEGAESRGTFVNFKLDIGQPVTRGMRVYFRGTAPQGNDYYTVQLVFKDIKGNRYPTEPHRFNPLPIPERVAIERGGHL